VLGTLLSVTLFAVTLEVALRVAPVLVPTHALRRFEPGLRGRIAKGRFSTNDETVILERDDGGPEMRIYKPFTTIPYRIDDPGSAKFVSTDEIGFCNPPGSYDATATTELISIGDSFTWCHAIDSEKAWARRVGALTGLTAYNLGKGGQGPYEYLQILKRFGLKRSPRAVILNVFGGNDLRDALEFQRFRAHPESVEPDPATAGWRATWPARSSYSFNLVCAGVEYLGERGALAREKEAIDFRYRVGTDERSVLFNRDQMDRDEVLCSRRLRAGEVDLSVFDEALRTFVLLGREHGFAPIVAYTPTAHAAHRGRIIFNDPSLADDLDWSSQEQRRYFAAKSAELGYHYVDLTPHLKAAMTDFEPEHLLYYPTTLHYSPSGHEVVARALADLLARIGVVDAGRDAN
jgi:lysophospholipase L1-like esterase